MVTSGSYRQLILEAKRLPRQDSEALGDGIRRCKCVTRLACKAQADEYFNSLIVHETDGCSSVASDIHFPDRDKQEFMGDTFVWDSKVKDFGRAVSLEM